jgi:hypothetical protein
MKKLDLGSVVISTAESGTPRYSTSTFVIESLEPAAMLVALPIRSDSTTVSAACDRFVAVKGYSQG